MKNLLTYEQYLPYFGVKQALDDSVEISSEKKKPDFRRIYTVSPTWWKAWQEENKDKYTFKQDAFSKTFEVFHQDKLIFILDYGRNKIFTNEMPQFLILKKDIAPEELEKMKDEEEDDGNSKKDKDKDKKSEEE